MSDLKKRFVWMVAPLLKFILRIFFDAKYITGRHFDSGIGGYIFSLKSIWVKNILRLSKPMPFPTSLTCTIANPKNLIFHPDDLNNFQSPGTYYQNFRAKIVIGRGTYIAPNVGIITTNHDLNNLDNHDGDKDVTIGEKCWIGMNSVILPGVVLGNKTIVAAGAIVTKSFEEGNVVLAGIPAKVIKNI
ncbi:acyltransferase [Acinetobacter indicus]|uniref:acyltransferase n=1 Tax=Acinetobacter indicus TaxID=756892 RepID=UPI000CEC98C6|nr:acyltransferase [Acinetobacter indicus]